MGVEPPSSSTDTPQFPEQHAPMVHGWPLGVHASTSSSPASVMQPAAAWHAPEHGAPESTHVPVSSQL
jgi:hypothetical protein